jgi:hypothetical protein
MRPLFDRTLQTSAEDESDDYSVRPFRNIVAKYNRVASDLFELSDLDSCDVAIVPVDWEHVRGGSKLAARPDRQLISRIRGFAEAVQRAGKPVVIFFASSMSHEPIPVRGAYVFRHAMFRSLSSDRDLAMPVVIARDIRKEFRSLSFAPAPKGNKPKISFCGLARPLRNSERIKSIPYRAYTLLKTGMRIPSPYLGLELRKQCLEALERSPLVDTDFIAQTRGVYLVRDKDKISKRESYRLPFVQNILDSPYHLSLRGSSNHSFRHWEILCCGRIPVYIDTDCGIPASDFVNWSDVMVRIDEQEVDRLIEHILDFHNQFTDWQFEDAQEKARRLWEEWCTPHGFASKLYKYVDTMSAH